MGVALHIKIEKSVILRILNINSVDKGKLLLKSVSNVNSLFAVLYRKKIIQGPIDVLSLLFKIFLFIIFYVVNLL